MFSKKYLRIILTTFITSILSVSAQQIDLSGTWKFRMDPTNCGESEKWYSDSLFSETVILPGSMLTNNKGYEVDINTPWMGTIVDQSYFNSDKYKIYRDNSKDFKVPFWLQPDLYYAGPAWYKKEVNIPSTWEGQDVFLILERPHWQTSVWIDNNKVGQCNSLGTQHLFEITPFVTPGNSHTLSVRVDNKTNEIVLGENSHSISDHTQGNWNGIVGNISIYAKPKVHIDNLYIYPSLDKGTIDIIAEISNNTNSLFDVNLDGKVGKQSENKKVTLQKGTSNVALTISTDSTMQEWDEFNPNLYQLLYAISDKKGNILDCKKERFGFRKWTTSGNQLSLNGHPVFMRGTLNCAIFPHTGFVSMEKYEWMREMLTCKKFGINHIRFHSWCPPEIAFAVADELGIYLQVECSSWANQGATIGDGKPIDDYIIDESKRMLRTYGNHPSFCMMAYGNEPAGDNQLPYLENWVKTMRELDPRRLYVTAAGWPNTPISDYYCDPTPRIQGWGEGNNSIINSKSPNTSFDWRNYINKMERPLISHEIGQWCAYPNYKEIVKYTGVYKPRNFEIFLNSLSDNGLSHLADSFLMASGKLQAICYKADIEAALRTPNMGGFQLLGLSDFSGQGTALVGVLDAFWEEKGYVDANTFRNFNNSFVPLARMPKLLFTPLDTLKATIEIANFEKPVYNTNVNWRIIDDNNCVKACGSIPAPTIEIGNGCPLGNISVELTDFSTGQYILEVEANNHKNDWNIWVFDNSKPIPTDNVRIVQNLDKSTISYLQKGGKAILSLPLGSLKDEFGGNIQVGFSSIFWNTSWTQGQAPHTLGILCNSNHQALKLFPTSWHSDYQWQEIIRQSQAIRCDAFSSKADPIVRIIDDWYENRSLGLIFETKIGKGHLLISGIDFYGDLATKPSVESMKRSLISYLNESESLPETEIRIDEIISLIK